MTFANRKIAAYTHRLFAESLPSLHFYLMSITLPFFTPPPIQSAHTPCSLLPPFPTHLVLRHASSYLRKYFPLLLAAKVLGYLLELFFLVLKQQRLDAARKVFGAEAIFPVGWYKKRNNILEILSWKGKFASRKLLMVVSRWKVKNCDKNWIDPAL